VNGLCVRAAGAEEIVRPRRLVGAFGRPLNFTVRRHEDGMAHDLRARFRDAFAADQAAVAPMTLREGDAIDSYAAPPSRDETDAVTDDYLEKYCWGLPHLDPDSWRHYLPALADLAQRRLSSNSDAIGAMINSLRPPDREPPRLTSLTPLQEAAVRELLELLAFSPDSAYQAEACQALEEWWIEDALYRAKAGHGGAV
jgi:hypothetical protein